MLHHLLTTQSYLITLLIIVAVSGDYMVSHSKLQIYKALFDNSTHALIGGICWVLVIINNKNHNTYGSIFEIFLCTLFSSIIDLDHFYAAKSTYLKDATDLPSRPPLHSTTIPLLFTPVGLILTILLDLKWFQKLTLIIFTAFATHHTRDATRRGYWIAPIGSTPPVPYYLYIMITVSIPYLVSISLKYLSVDRVYKYTNITV